MKIRTLDWVNAQLFTNEHAFLSPTLPRRNINLAVGDKYCRHQFMTINFHISKPML